MWLLTNNYLSDFGVWPMLNINMISLFVGTMMSVLKHCCLNWNHSVIAGIIWNKIDSQSITPYLISMYDL